MVKIMYIKWLLIQLPNLGDAKITNLKNMT